MSKPNNGGPAFPLKEPLSSDSEGMTLRDYFAAKTMVAVMSNPGGAIQQNSACGWSLCNCTADQVAEFAYSMADAMLAERDKAI